MGHVRCGIAALIMDKFDGDRYAKMKASYKDKPPNILQKIVMAY